MNIRPYEKRDKESVHYVCLNSEGPFKGSKRDMNFILTVYCDYYLEKEPENCFVAVDENDRVVGYIISAEDFDLFRKGFKYEYYPRIKKWEFCRRKST